MPQIMNRIEDVPLNGLKLFPSVSGNDEVTYQN
jgi:hypothetical protein